MVYALEMFFDKRSENKILEYFKKSKYLTDVKSVPHITLAIFNDINIEKSNNKLRNFCLDNKKFNLYFSNLGLFTAPNPCIFLSPVATEKLLNLNKEIYNIFSEYSTDGFEYYKPCNWVPHCAVDITKDKDDIINSLNYFLKEFKPFEVTIEKIAFVEITKPVRRLKSFELQ